MQNKRFDEIKIPESLGRTVRDGVNIGWAKRRKAKRRRRLLHWGAAAAAILLVALSATILTANPSLAAKLPLIGRIFRTVEADVGYQGTFSENALPLSREPEENTGDGAEEQVLSPYVQTSNGITFTVSEVVYTNQALYLAVCIENEEAFPEDFELSKVLEDYALDHDRMQMLCFNTFEAEGLDLSGAVNSPPYHIQGKFTDSHTFAGIIRVNTDHQWWPSEAELNRAGLDIQNFQSDTDYANALQEHFPDAGKKVELPEEFTYTLTIVDIFADLMEKEEVELTASDGTVSTISKSVKKHYEGEWSFTFDVDTSMSKSQVVEVNQTNQDGIGIRSVKKSPYEISAECLLPEGISPVDYITVICDANGNKLESQGEIAEVFSTYGRDTSKIYVHVCDYSQYMNELKGDSKKIEEHALFTTQVSFD